MLELIHRLRLEPTPATFEAAGKPVQKSQTAKHTNDNEYYELTEQYCQERLQRYFDVSAARGITLPSFEGWKALPPRSRPSI